MSIFKSDRGERGHPMDDEDELDESEMLEDDETFPAPKPKRIGVKPPVIKIEIHAGPPVPVPSEVEQKEAAVKEALRKSQAFKGEGGQIMLADAEGEKDQKNRDEIDGKVESLVGSVDEAGTKLANGPITQWIKNMVSGMGPGEAAKKAVVSKEQLKEIAAKSREVGGSIGEMAKWAFKVNDAKQVIEGARDSSNSEVLELVKDADDLRKQLKDSKFADSAEGVESMETLAKIVGEIRRINDDEAE